LPREDLERFGCQPNVPVEQALAESDRWIELVRFEAVRTASLYESSSVTEQYLTGGGRRMFRLMHATYRALLTKIERDPAAVLTHRLRVSRPEKAWIALRTLVG
jgi:phytoene/squalene synthetase